MKQRRIWKAALAMCILGAICAGISFFLSGGTARAFADMLSDMDTRNQFEERVYEAEGPVTRLIVSDESYGVTVVPSEDGGARARYTESKNDWYEVELRNGALVIEYKKDKPWYWNFSFGLKEYDRTVRVEVPADALEALTVSCVTGDSSVSGLTIDGDAVLTTVNGTLAASDLTIRGALTVSNVSGDTRVSSCKVDGALRADTVNGSARLDSCEAGKDMIVGSVNGSVSLTGVRAAGALTADTTNGRVTLDDADGASIALSSVNGDIEAKLSGKASEYAYNRACAQGEKPLNAETLNGDIRIEYAQ